MKTVLANFDEVDFNIAWRRMISMAYSKNFDMKAFQKLAKKTYRFLATFQDKESVPRCYLGSIMLVHEFATIAPTFMTKEALAATQVMATIINLFIDDFLDAESHQISVEDNLGNNHIINTTNFDLSELIQDNEHSF